MATSGGSEAPDRKAGRRLGPRGTKLDLPKRFSRDLPKRPRGVRPASRDAEVAGRKHEKIDAGLLRRKCELRCDRLPGALAGIARMILLDLRRSNRRACDQIDHLDRDRDLVGVLVDPVTIEQGVPLAAVGDEQIPWR